MASPRLLLGLVGYRGVRGGVSPVSPSPRTDRRPWPPATPHGPPLPVNWIHGTASLGRLPALDVQPQGSAAPKTGPQQPSAAWANEAERRGLQAGCCAARNREGSPGPQGSAVRNPREGPWTRTERNASGPAAQALPAASGVSPRPPLPARRRGSGRRGAGSRGAAEAAGGGEDGPLQVRAGA